MDAALGRYEPDLSSATVRRESGRALTRFDVDPNESVLCTEDRERLPPRFLKELQDIADAQTRSPAVVAGRLAQHGRAWKEVARDDPYALSIVLDGYKVPLAAPVVPRRFKNHQGCYETPEHTAFITKAVADLLMVGAARVVDPDYPVVISPLNVAFKKGAKKFRLIIDMRWFNMFVFFEKFKFELHRREGREVCLPGHMLALLDLAQAYHHTQIRVEDQPYFGFE
jgi:hypothetical protein